MIARIGRHVIQRIVLEIKLRALLRLACQRQHVGGVGRPFQRVAIPQAVIARGGGQRPEHAIIDALGDDVARLARLHQEMRGVDAAPGVRITAAGPVRKRPRRHHHPLQLRNTFLDEIIGAAALEQRGLDQFGEIVEGEQGEYLRGGLFEAAVRIAQQVLQAAGKLDRRQRRNHQFVLAGFGEKLAGEGERGCLAGFE